MPQVFLTGLVFGAPDIIDDEGLERVVRGIREVADEHGFEPLKSRQQSISVMLANMRDSQRARAAEEIKAKVVAYLQETREFASGQLITHFVYAMKFPNRRFTSQEVQWLRAVPHKDVEQIIGFGGADFLQVWLKSLLPPNEALSVVQVVAAQTQLGYL